MTFSLTTIFKKGHKSKSRDSQVEKSKSSLVSKTSQIKRPEWDWDQTSSPEKIEGKSNENILKCTRYPNGNRAPVSSFTLSGTNQQGMSQQRLLRSNSTQQKNIKKFLDGHSRSNSLCSSIAPPPRPAIGRHDWLRPRSSLIQEKLGTLDPEVLAVKAHLAATQSLALHAPREMRSVLHPIEDNEDDLIPTAASSSHPKNKIYHHKPRGSQHSQAEFLSEFDAGSQRPAPRPPSQLSPSPVSKSNDLKEKLVPAKYDFLKKSSSLRLSSAMLTIINEPSISCTRASDQSPEYSLASVKDSSSVGSNIASNKSASTETSNIASNTSSTITLQSATPKQTSLRLDSSTIKSYKSAQSSTYDTKGSARAEPRLLSPLHDLGPSLTSTPELEYSGSVNSSTAAENLASSPESDVSIAIASFTDSPQSKTFANRQSLHLDHNFHRKLGHLRIIPVNQSWACSKDTRPVSDSCVRYSKLLNHFQQEEFKYPDNWPLSDPEPVWKCGIQDIRKQIRVFENPRQFSKASIAEHVL